MKRITVLISVLLLLGGCASAPTADNLSDSAAYAAIGECYRAQATKDAAELAKMETSTDVQLLAAINALKVAANKDYSPCSGIVTNAELQKVAIQENTKRLYCGFEFAKSAMTTALWAYLGGKAIDAVSEMSGNDYNFTDSTVTDSLNSNNGGGDFNLGTSEPFVVEPSIIEVPAI